MDGFDQPVASLNSLARMELTNRNSFDVSEIALAKRIKETRRSRGWSLMDFEEASGGEIKAVVLGSYERCSRAISIRKLTSIARVFDLPVGYLLGNEFTIRQVPHILMIDIRRVRKSLRESAIEKFFTFVIDKRGDWNGEILTLRLSDLDVLSLLSGSGHEATLTYLKENKYLLEPNLK